MEDSSEDRRAWRSQECWVARAESIGKSVDNSDATNDHRLERVDESLGSKGNKHAPAVIAIEEVTSFRVYLDDSETIDNIAYTQNH